MMYADDIALVTETKQQMQSALELVDQIFTQWGLEMSMKKTQILPLGKVTDSASEELSITLQRGEIEVVEEFKYLGSISSSSLSMQSEFGQPLEKGRSCLSQAGKINIWQRDYVICV